MAAKEAIIYLHSSLRSLHELMLGVVTDTLPTSLAGGSSCMQLWLFPVLGEAASTGPLPSFRLEQQVKIRTLYNNTYKGLILGSSIWRF